MVNPGQHWSCCINNWELLRSLSIAAHLDSLSLPTVASAFIVRARSNDKFDSSSELCEDKDEMALIFTSGGTLADWFSTRGDKLSRCCRKCSSVSFRRELNMSDAFLMPTAPIEFDRHSATKRKIYSYIIYLFFFFTKNTITSSQIFDMICQRAIIIMPWETAQHSPFSKVAKKKKKENLTSYFHILRWRICDRSSCDILKSDRGIYPSLLGEESRGSRWCRGHLRRASTSWKRYVSRGRFVKRAWTRRSHRGNSFLGASRSVPLMRFLYSDSLGHDGTTFSLFQPIGLHCTYRNMQGVPKLSKVLLRANILWNIPRRKS